MNEKLTTIQAYDKTASIYNKTHFEPFWVKEFELYKKLVPGKKVLDIGCGAGRDAVVFVKNKFDYLGIDASERMLKVAKERVKKGKFRKMDFYKLKFPANSFDGTWAAASLLHIPKNRIRDVLKQIKRILKSGGISLISLKEKRDFEEGFVPYERNPGTFRYWSYYTQKEFEGILKSVGFKIIKFMKHKEKEKDGSTTIWLCFFARKPI